METIPVFLKVRGKKVLVVGTTAAALEKIEYLKKAGARITLLVPPGEELGFQVPASPLVTVLARAFSGKIIDGHVLVFSAASNSSLNKTVSKAAKKQNIPVNVFDSADDCTFNMPAIIDRDPVVVAISSDGNSPTLAGLIRRELEIFLPEKLGRVASTLGAFRPQIKKVFANFESRQQFWQRFLRGQPLETLAQQKPSKIRAALVKALNSPARQTSKGKVWLVGAGPGDPGLLTLKARQTLGRADVVFFDRLVNSKILDLIQPHADAIYVGKSPGQEGGQQEAINRKIVAAALTGKQVVRLKSGDPLLFGRAGEELNACHTQGVDVEIIPGITSALAAAAAGQIPLTCREQSSTLILATGKLKNGEVNDFSGFNDHSQTLAIYMGIGGASEIEDNLLEQGLDPATPVAVISNASRPDEQQEFGFLSGLAALVREKKIKAPAIIYVGHVIARARDYSCPLPDVAATQTGLVGRKELS